MLGCKEKVTRFDPNYFCNTNRTFISIMTLGNDVYYQEIGRFWRYSSKGIEFIDYDNYESIKAIRFDSDITAFLENHGFGDYFNTCFLIYLNCF